jgi:hypothetical protein
MTTALPQGPVLGRVAFEEVVRQSIEAAAAEGWKNLCWMDPDFSDWPLGERRVHDALQAWSRTGRRLVLLAKDYRALMAKHHRFVLWRRQWAHIVECWQCQDADPAEFPSLILAPAWALHRVDRDRGVCHATVDPGRLRQFAESQQAWRDKSSPGFPAHVLGL